jgi:predicted TIM-barrel fold metal-dependent hydrolase
MIPITDTHLHLVYQDRFTYAWLGGAPKLNRQWTVESYFAEAEPLGITEAIHMEVDVAEEQMLAEVDFTLNAHRRVVAAIANGRPEHKGFPAYLDELDERFGGKVKAVRRLLQFHPPELSATPIFVENVKRLNAHNLAFDICVKSHELEVARKLVAACPDVQFVLDHCGNPKIAEKEWDGWAIPLAAIAAMPNVNCKVSGILANVADGWRVDDLRPYVEHVIDTFGWDRVVWGSDHPVVTLFADLTAWVRATREIVAGASIGEQEKLLHRNAARIYRLS